MLRIPVYSLALGAVGVAIGLALGDEHTAAVLMGYGCLIGYAIWLRARLLAFKAGKPFHAGTVLNVLICTVVGIGIGLAAIAGDSMSNRTFLWVTLSISTVAIWLHWHVATRIRVLPSMREGGQEVVGSVLAHDVGVATAHAVFEVGKDIVKDIKE